MRGTRERIRERIRKRARLRRASSARSALAVSIALFGLVGAVPTFAHDHDPKSSGHPLRIAAYALHPVGVVLDYVIFRPAHWLVSFEPLQTLFGHEEEELGR